MLITIGVLLVSGQWDHLMNVLRADVGQNSGFNV
jgi:hypothetical protein